MRQKLSFLFFLLLQAAFFRCAAQAPPVFDWQKCLGGTNADVPSKILQTNDGGYLIIGSTSSNNGDVTGNHGMSDVWVVKTDVNGNILWKHCYGGTNVDAGVTGVEFSGGKIFVLSNANSSNGNVTNHHGFSDVWLLCLDLNGSLLWQKTYGGSADDVAHAMLLTSDNNLLLGCSSGSVNGDVTNNHGGDDFWLIKVDTMGNLLWQKTLGGSGQDICYSLEEADDGGYIAGGGSNSTDGDITFNAGQFDFWITKTDPSGAHVWEKTFGGSSADCAFTVVKNDAGNFVFGGYSNSSDSGIDNHGSSDFWAAEIDPSGNQVNQFSFGGGNSDISFSIIQADADGYLLSGSSYSRNYDLLNTDSIGGEESWLMKTDLNGNLIWSRTYGGTQNDRISSILQTPDGGYIMTGRTFSNDYQVSGNHGSADIWVLKLSCFIPQASFTFLDDTVCVNSLIGFTNTSFHAAAYSWQADGIEFNLHTNANFQFVSPGNYEISLVGSTCYASDTMKHTFVVIDHFIPALYTPQNFLCESTILNISTDYANSYLWSTGQTASSIQVNSPGNYSVITDRHGCVDTSNIILIADYSIVPFTLGPDTQFCAGTNFELNAPAGHSSYLWQNGSTNPVYYAPAAGTYYVTIGNGYCTLSDTILLTTQNCALPVPDFSTALTSICTGTCIDFTNLSINADSFVWIFEGADPASDTVYVSDPTNICYNTTGIFTVELYASNANGSNSISRIGYITVNENPTAPLISAYGNTVQADSVMANYSYQWYYQGTAIPGSTNAIDTVEWDGFYHLVVTNSYGCSASSDPIYIQVTSVNNLNDNSTNAIYPNPACDFITVSLNNSDMNNTSQVILLFDATGKVVLSENLDGTSPLSFITIPLTNIESGIYFLQSPGSQHVQVNKLVVSHSCKQR